jgi:hypothetical protein
MKDIKMADNLTPKEEAFAQKFVELGNASEAYRIAYQVSEDTKQESVWSMASRLLSKHNVSQRVIELQDMHRERHEITIDSLTEELEIARKMAMDGNAASAAVSAIMGKAKLHGLLVVKNEHTGKDGGSIEHTVSKIEHTIIDPNAPSYSEFKQPL